MAKVKPAIWAGRESKRGCHGRPPKQHETWTHP
jgi:hypothetical protein